MSKRYGRNQRRRHREQIAELEALAASQEQRAVRAEDKHHQLERLLGDWDDEVCHLLGEYSAFRMRPSLGRG